MTTKIVWRLANRPTPKEITDLLNAGILTKDESREILFSLETDEDRDKKSLESEIKFLRELVEKLANSPSKIVETIRYVQPTYIQQPWFQPYVTWTSATTGGYTSLTTSNGYIGGTATNAINTSFNTSASGSGGGSLSGLNASAQAQAQSNSASNSFSSIKTF